MKKTFKRLIVACAVVALLTGGMIAYGRLIDPPVPPSCITLQSKREGDSPSHILK